MNGMQTFENGVKVKQPGSIFNGWIEFKFTEGPLAS